MKEPSRFVLLWTLVGALLSLSVGSPRVLSSTPITHSFRASVQEPAGEITKSNWRQHPKIKAIRAIVQSVDAGMKGQSLTVKKRAFEYCEPYEDAARSIATDSIGRVHFYGNEAGSDDSALRWKHYYDENGRLRFVFISGGAVNGSELEHRIYFDQNGTRVWEDHVYKKGPGYTFPEIWPDEQLQISNPAEKFASKSPCPEKKIKPSGSRSRLPLIYFSGER